ERRHTVNRQAPGTDRTLRLRAGQAGGVTEEAVEAHGRVIREKHKNDVTAFDSNTLHGYHLIMLYPEFSFFSLEALCQIRLGYTFRERPQASADGDTVVIQMANIEASQRLKRGELLRIHADHLNARHLVREGDLLFRSRSSTNTAVVVPADLGRAVLAAPMIHLRPRRADVLPDYLAWAINHPRTQATLATHARGSRSQMIGIPALRSLTLPLPPAAVQRAIAEMAQLAVRERELLVEVSRLRQHLLHHQLWAAASQHPAPARKEKLR
ncbi:MAG: hypothetical protein MUE86_05715, partial [Thiobacillaceae bacterium]|nr:hypothetical protein [Thiobacillaceae bacterium]